MTYQPLDLVNLRTHSKIALRDFPNEQVHAVAGIGHPQRFFDQLQDAGLKLIPHVFPDHHRYRCQDLDFKEHFPVMMTEKDAVKCAAFAKEDYWYLPITVKISYQFQQALLTKLQEVEEYQ